MKRTALLLLGLLASNPVLPAELTWYLTMTQPIVPNVPSIADGTLKLADTSSLASLIDWSALGKSSLRVSA